jgi:putative phage-type endonuclease
MTLHVYDDLEQGSDEWHDVRRGMVTASVVGRLITAKTIKAASNDDSRGLTALLAAERITGWTDSTYVNEDMWRGKIDEPRARDTYSEHYTPAVEVGFMVREDAGWRLGYSPDGLVGDDGLIEVKCPRAKGHIATIVRSEIPAHYMAQLQAGLLVSGRQWIDYISFCGGLPMWVQRVTPDERWHEAIVEAVTTCEAAIEEVVAQYRESVTGLPMTERMELVVI